MIVFHDLRSKSQTWEDRYVCRVRAAPAPVTRSERSDKLNGINARPDKLLSLKRANVSVDDSSFGRPKRTKWPPENSILRSKNSPRSSIGLRPLIFCDLDSDERRPSRTAAALRICSSIKSAELTPVMDDPSKNCIRDNVVNAQRQSQRELHHMAVGIVGELSSVLGLKSLMTEWYSEFA